MFHYDYGRRKIRLHFIAIHPMTASQQRWLDWVEQLIIDRSAGRRYTQDSPVYEDVWIAFAKNAIATPKSGIEVREELLLSMHRDANAVDAVSALSNRLKQSDVSAKAAEGKVDRDTAHSGGPTRYGLAYNDSHISVRLTFREMVRCVLPLTHWWNNYVFRKSWLKECDEKDGFVTHPGIQFGRDEKRRLRNLVKRSVSLADRGELPRDSSYPLDLVWFVLVAGAIHAGPTRGGNPRPYDKLIDSFIELLQLHESTLPFSESPLIWSVSRNRPIEISVERSTLTTKADAALHLFRVDASELNWGVIDSGIDATHVAFRRRDAKGTKHAAPFESSTNGRLVNNTRIRATYDFTRLRSCLEIPVLASEVVANETISSFQKGLYSGRSLPWGELVDELRVDYPPAGAPAGVVAPIPGNDHGTHVAGTLAGEWRKGDEPSPPGESLDGICPTINLYDLRVFNASGKGDEFAVLSALQFVRYLNTGKDQPIIHGVNLSLSIHHDVRNFACGSTPVCEECERLVASGVVVVAAAGNLGYARFVTENGERSEGFRVASLTDPGNAERVITVGSTHRTQPHRYGVSYFSSRGPTGDGRHKPDIVAPGEKIVAAAPGNRSVPMDGTSMAAPHVSGAAAILMARHKELIGRPDKVKEVLMKSATDLGRERYFQGAGLLDILRALQSV